VASVKAVSFDEEALPFQQAGIHVLCEDLRPLTDAGPEPVVPEVVAPAGPVPAAIAADPEILWAFTLASALLKDGAGPEFPATLSTARGILEEISDHRFFCMSRHLLQSIVRMAALTPKQDQEARDAGLPDSPTPLKRALIKNQIELLATTGLIERLASTLQAHEIPIICNDVPPIPDPAVSELASP
jgi:hypothetical protein